MGGGGFRCVVWCCFSMKGYERVFVHTGFSFTTAIRLFGKVPTTVCGGLADVNRAGDQSGRGTPWLRSWEAL